MVGVAKIRQSPSKLRLALATTSMKITDLIVPLSDPLTLPFESMLAKSYPELLRPDSCSPLDSIKYRLRYPAYMPIITASVACIASLYHTGIMDPITGRPFGKGIHAYLGNAGKFIRIAMIGQLTWSFLTCATWNILGVDGYGTRALFGAVSGYAIGAIANSYRLGFWAVPILAAGSVALKFFEDGGIGMSRIVRYERERERALQLLDPMRPDYADLRDKLTPKRSL